MASTPSKAQARVGARGLRGLPEEIIIDQLPETTKMALHRNAMPFHAETYVLQIPHSFLLKEGLTVVLPQQVLCNFNTRSFHVSSCVLLSMQMRIGEMEKCLIQVQVITVKSTFV